jgi:REP-associated tyrosine transposase
MEHAYVLGKKMSQKFDPEKHHRRSIRLKGYDYTQPGGYFITLVTYKRECLFGEIINGEMKLSDSGHIASACWKDIPNHFPNVELGTFVIMPNHVHGIIILNNGVDAQASARRGTIDRAPTEQFGKPVVGSIPTIIRTFKAAVTRRIGHELKTTGIWQRNYYEHIIRDDKESDRIHRYIVSNPIMWESDNENPPVRTT